LKNDKVYLQHILDEIGYLNALRSTLTYEDLRHDVTTEHAVMWSFQIIGEATKKISTETRKAHPEIPWTDMAGLRDRIEPKIRALLNHDWMDFSLRGGAAISPVRMGRAGQPGSC
jgi:uncharacterized protein with HEPN domain